MSADAGSVSGQASAEGLVLYEWDGGLAWDPWGLALVTGGVKFGADTCSDYGIRDGGFFFVGPVRNPDPRTGTVSADTVNLSWELDSATDANLLSEVSANVDREVGTTGAVSVTVSLSGAIASQGTMSLNFAARYSAADGGSLLKEETRQLILSRGSPCE